ncbi:hypothetical protein GCM10008934_23280 [Virgibacillus salarius]
MTNKGKAHWFLLGFLYIEECRFITYYPIIYISLWNDGPQYFNWDLFYFVS